uniref:Uncharacterized protein n=1 Tax=Setaria italica TaxID=4555 RepID=K4AP15_SETIT
MEREGGGGRGVKKICEIFGAAGRMGRRREQGR